MAAQLLGVDLSPEMPPHRQALERKLRDARSRTPSGAWVRASRYDHTATTDGHILTRDELDSLSPTVPSSSPMSERTGLSSTARRSSSPGSMTALRTRPAQRTDATSTVA